MASLLIHAALGLLTIILYFRINGYLFTSGWQGSRVSGWEAVCYGLAVVSVCLGWYFNIQYVFGYPNEYSWMHFIKLLFTNPAAGSGSQDLIITNTFLFPLWTMLDGPRRGLKHCWLYFVMSLFTSFGFAMGLYLAVLERQVRWQKTQ
jgi:hypothetical protein